VEGLLQEGQHQGVGQGTVWAQDVQEQGQAAQHLQQAEQATAAAAAAAGNSSVGGRTLVS
jgi:hypothetical protein